MSDPQVCVIALAGRSNGDPLPKAKPVLIIADDFGISDGVSDAILELAQMGRISGFSCMVNYPEWKQQAAKIPKNLHKLVGLHLNLTSGVPLSRNYRHRNKYDEFCSLRQLTARSCMGMLDKKTIAEEIALQIEHFVLERHHLPHMIDGHQHVHILPIVRRALLDVLSDIDPERKILVRDPTDTMGHILARRAGAFKALLLNTLGMGFGSTFRQRGWPTNLGFSGYSAFEDVDDFRAVFKPALKALGERHMVMVHPGHAHDSGLLGRDYAIDTRPMEFGYLKSVRYIEDLAMAEVRVSTK